MLVLGDLGKKKKKHVYHGYRIRIEKPQVSS